MLGPGLALRGSEGSKSLHKAIEVLQFQSKLTLVFFMLSLLFFHISSILLLFVNFGNVASTAVSTMLLAFTALYFIKGREVFRKLYISDKEAVTGEFIGFSGYDKVTDLEKFGSDPRTQTIRDSPREPSAQQARNLFAQGVFDAVKDMFT